ncbi:unnamed protein product [Rhizoctonia solani]|uniref:Uncharacterized protein n=1 Tax=Rhizoctonia solani TaxID=456999 RepID=A0A8H3AXR6_9AGAM|nr:unnamed protein product [Rhizoctonia solani]
MPFLSPNPATLPLGGSFVNSGSFLGPGSFVLASSNRISASSFAGRTLPPHKIGFTEGWGQGPTEKWYEGLKGHTTFRKLQYRKERVAPFNHEFIVVELDNNTVCRFDRRGDINSRANVLIGESIPSEDTAHVIAKSDADIYPLIEATSDLLLTMQFPQGEDLRTILAICYGIQTNEHTRFYTLTRYNCYFFSWMIITATARRTVDWAILARPGELWKALVTSAMQGLSPDSSKSGPLEHSKSKVSMPFGAKNKEDLPVPSQFVGSAYLVSTLQTALEETREQIRRSLAELILHSTVDNAMQSIAQTSSNTAGNKAARSHAAQAARDSAMEAVIENMWQEIISDEHSNGTSGGDIWEDKCMLAEACVQDASTAAADAVDQSRRIAVASTVATAPEEVPPPQSPAINGVKIQVKKSEGYQVDLTASDNKAETPTQDPVTPGAIPAPPAKWETAWEAAWEKTWATGKSKQGSNTTDPSKKNISDRAKAAWTKAWEEACEANEKYVPLISQGVAQYVIKNLPKALPTTLTYETDPNVVKSIVKALKSTSDSDSNLTSQLQDWVKDRIAEHCQRVSVLTAGAQHPSNTEFENTMKCIWEATLKCLPDLSESEIVDNTISGNLVVST